MSRTQLHSAEHSSIPKRQRSGWITRDSYKVRREPNVGLWEVRRSRDTRNDFRHYRPVHSGVSGPGAPQSCDFRQRRFTGVIHVGTAVACSLQRFGRCGSARPHGLKTGIMQQGASSGSPIFYEHEPAVVGMMAGWDAPPREFRCARPV
jgi:hypothetical protein